MDEEMEDFVEEFLEPSEIDLDYEFDASQFYDFTRPDSNSEAGEAERWFEIAGSYPPSPLVIKLLGKGNPSSSNDAKSLKSTSNKADVAAGSEVPQSTKNCKGIRENVQAKTKPVPRPSKPRSSTLMKPTASHLAKLNKASHAHSNYLCRRSHKPYIPTGERGVHSPHGFDNAATKRQKLEMGYLRKVAQLKHQNLLLHKISRKGGTTSGNVAHSKTKVTIPKEPELKTQQRAQNRRKNGETSEHAETRTHTFKARPLNKKMLQAPLLLPPKKGRQLPEFQLFHLETMDRAMQHSSANDLNTKNSDSASQGVATDLRRSKSRHGTKEKCENLLKIRPRSLNSKIFPTKEDVSEMKNINEATNSVESKLAKNERLSQNPPTELFNKLSLISELEDTVSPPKPHLPTKGSKENAPDSFQPQSWYCVKKPNQCGSGGIAGTAQQPNMNRSLSIR